MGSRVIPDMTGNRFGMLVVVGRSPSVGNGAAWLCLCDCGASKVVSGGNLRSGSTISCGCKRRRALTLGLNHRLEDSEACARIAVFQARKSARVRGVEWTLTDERARALLCGDCHYCGSPPSNRYRLPNDARGSLLRNGIDRVDNAHGYVDGNVVSCCKQCNYAKRDQSIADFTAWVDRLLAHRESTRGVLP